MLKIKIRKSIVDIVDDYMYKPASVALVIKYRYETEMLLDILAQTYKKKSFLVRV